MTTSYSNIISKNINGFFMRSITKLPAIITNKNFKICENPGQKQNAVYSMKRVIIGLKLLNYPYRLV